MSIIGYYYLSKGCFSNKTKYRVATYSGKLKEFRFNFCKLKKVCTFYKYQGSFNVLNFSENLFLDLNEN